MVTKTIGVVGCGNMGSALIENLRKRSAVYDVVIFDKEQEKTKGLSQRFDVQVAESLKHLFDESAILIIAVKPQDIDEVLSALKGVSRKLVVSIAAGITMSYLESAIGAKVAIVRAMPNINAIIGHSVTALSVNASVGDDDKAAAKRIFEAVGDVVFVPEAQMNAVTAVSGSGPAFVAYLVRDLGEKVMTDVMIKEAVALGIDKEAARRLVDATISGTRRILAVNFDASVLIQRVSSKGGTTEAGMKVLESEGKTAGALAHAIQAACQRAGELARK